MAETSGLREGVSPQTDELASTLMGDALDLLAAGEAFEVLLAVQGSTGEVMSFEFVDDGPEACLEGARAKVAELKDAVRYAICYEGAIEGDDGSFSDALLLEFGERGYRSYSAFSLVDGKGAGDGFTWTDPAPAGELPPLL
ncbi:hypothetical protein H6A23_06765 [Olsenella uli]|uniref:hypothetical protein n=1 Tax=Olsenella uli TaxID=133926 RepID=UPI00195E0A1B|nr:hypothetical protein [Olsenella uli]MBM6816868.1 hypothetical protein [Olsenella uli]